MQGDSATPTEADPPTPAAAAGSGLAGLRVGVDRRDDGFRRTGVGRYGAVLVETLRAAGAVVEAVSEGERPLPRPIRWLRAADGRPRRLRRTADGWTRADLFREAHAHFTLHGRLMPLACDHPPDVMHWTCPLPLRLEGARNVYAVHDLIPLESPELSGVDAGRHARLLDAIARSADALATVSEASRAAILRRLGDAFPVVNTLQAIGRLEPAPTRPAGLERDGYLLFCGAVEPRKNLARLVAAHARSGVRLPLVVAGPPGWRAGSALSPRAGAAVVRIPWLPRPQLLALVAGARALVLPSLAEGFGLPVAEAFALGVPAVTSRGGALEEVAGGAALLVDPEDEADIAAGLARVTHDEALRDRLRRDGLRRAADFTCALYASRLGGLYRAAAGAQTPARRHENFTELPVAGGSAELS